MHFYPRMAKIVFVNNEEVYAVLYKDNAISDHRPMNDIGDTSDLGVEKI